MAQVRFTGQASLHMRWHPLPEALHNLSRRAAPLAGHRLGLPQSALSARAGPQGSM